MKTRFNFPTRIIFGEQTINDLPSELAELKKKRPLLVTDKGLVSTPIPEKVMEIFKDAGMEAKVFFHVHVKIQRIIFRKITNVFSD